MIKNGKTKQLIVAGILLAGFVDQSLGMDQFKQYIAAVPGLFTAGLGVIGSSIGRGVREVAGVTDELRGPGGRTALEQSLQTVYLQAQRVLVNEAITNVHTVHQAQHQRLMNVVAQDPGVLPPAVSSATASRVGAVPSNRLGAILGTAIGYLPQSIATPLGVLVPRANELLENAQNTLTTVNRVTAVGGTVIVVGAGYLLYRKASHSKQQAEAIKQQVEMQKITNAQKRRELDKQLREDAISSLKELEDFIIVSEKTHQISQKIEDPNRKMMCLETQNQMFKDGLKAFGYVEREERREKKRKGCLVFIKNFFSGDLDAIPFSDEVV